MNIGLSDKIRTLAQTRYVDAAVKARKDHFSIRVKDLLVDLRPRVFPVVISPNLQRFEDV